jgi:hypothetical protein
LKQVYNWFIPIHTVSEANSSDHWTAKKKRHDLQKRWIWVCFKTHKPQIPLPCKIKLTRVGKKLLDSDNLPVSMKYIRDAIADQIFPGKAAGQADNDQRLSWEYDQKTSKKEMGVEIEIFSE